MPTRLGLGQHTGQDRTVQGKLINVLAHLRSGVFVVAVLSIILVQCMCLRGHGKDRF